MFRTCSISHRRLAKRPRSLNLEQLETRNLPAVITVNASQIVQPVNDQVLGANVNWWDPTLNTAQTQQLVQSAGLTLFRLPGGSAADTFHFNAPPSYPGQGTAASMASFIASVGGGGMVTLDYGSGSPQEAAAFLAYLNASTNNNTVIGMGQQWNPNTNTWVQVDWKTAGYWASLRAATPLATDDGLNFLRLSRAAPFGFPYYEVGNEEYGVSWEPDFHGQGGDHSAAHDPATYVTFAKQFAAYAAQIDGSISIGLDTGSIGEDNNWTANVLTQCATQGFTPGFLSDHLYVQEPGTESDSYLLHTVVNDPNQDPNSPHNWVTRATDYRNLLTQKLGAAGNSVALLATEFNSVSYNPGKQTTSLVNGLFVAQSLGQFLQSGYDGAIVWGLSNSWEPGNNNSASLYGWRQGGDYGLLGDSTGSLPATGAYVPYPSYFAEQLVSKIALGGGDVVQTTSDNSNLTAFAVQEANGHLGLLVINADPTNDVTDQIQVTGFQPSTQAQVWQYGKVQDTAQSQTTDGHAALANSTATLSLSGANFNYTFPSHSMTVLDLNPSTSALTVQGTPGNDVFTFTAGVPNRYSLNGVSHNVPAGVTTIHFVNTGGVGEGGSDSATLTGSGSDYAVLWPTLVTLSGNGYTVDAANMANVNVFSSGNADANFTTTAGNDTYVGTPTYSAALGNGYANYAVGFAQAHAWAGGTKAIAYLATSPTGQDMLGGVPTYSFVQGANYASYAIGFAQVDAWAGGHTATAYLATSAGQDTFVGLPNYSAVLGATYSVYAVGFAQVDAWSGGSLSVAYLNTAGNDFFRGSYAYSEATDVTNYNNFAIGFANVVATATGPNSTADFYDSPGDDTFTGSGWTGKLTGPNYSIMGTNFTVVRIYSTNGGTDRKFVSGIGYMLDPEGSWT